MQQFPGKARLERFLTDKKEILALDSVVFQTRKGDESYREDIEATIAAHDIPHEHVDVCFGDELQGKVISWREAVYNRLIQQGQLSPEVHLRPGDRMAKMPSDESRILFSRAGRRVWPAEGDSYETVSFEYFIRGLYPNVEIHGAHSAAHSFYAPQYEVKILEEEGRFHLKGDDKQPIQGRLIVPDTFPRSVAEIPRDTRPFLEAAWNGAPHTIHPELIAALFGGKDTMSLVYDSRNIGEEGNLVSFDNLPMSHYSHVVLVWDFTRENPHISTFHILTNVDWHISFEPTVIAAVGLTRYISLHVRAMVTQEKQIYFLGDRFLHPKREKRVLGTDITSLTGEIDALPEGVCTQIWELSGRRDLHMNPWSSTQMHMPGGWAYEYELNKS